MDGKRLHILQVIRQTTFGGGEVYLANLVREIRKAGHQTTILTFQNGQIGQLLKDEGFEVICYQSKSAFDIKIIKRVAALLSSKKYDLVHCHGTRAASNAVLPARWNGIPTIYTVHGWSFHPGLGKIQLTVRKLMERLLCNLASQVVAVGHQDAKTGVEQLGIKRPHVIVNGIPVSQFKSLPPIAPVKGQIRFGFIGRLTYQKYPELLAKAFEELAVTYPDSKLYFVGGGDLETAVKAAAPQALASGQLKFLPFSKDVSEELQLLDAVILPSRWEGLSLSLVETMAAGRLAIASDLPNNSEVVRDMETGLLFRASDQEDLRKKLEFALENPDTIKHLAKNGQASAHANFSFDRVASENLVLYTRMMPETH